jgi:hypothetical protein
MDYYEAPNGSPSHLGMLKDSILAMDSPRAMVHEVMPPHLTVVQAVLHILILGVAIGRRIVVTV